MSTVASTKTMQVLNPTGQANVPEVAMAPRLDSLEGKVVGLLDNTKANADVFLSRVEELLREKFRVAEIIRWRKPTASRAMPDRVLEQLTARCDLVINAFGD